MEEQKLFLTAVADLKDETNEKETTHSAYGTSSRELHVNANEPTECLSCRHILYTMMFFGFAVAYSLRVSLSEAIVAMVNQTAVSDVYLHSLTDNQSNSYQCPRDQPQHGYGEFNWDRHEQGTVLAAFYYGYILTQVVGGWLADRVGGKWLFGSGILGCAVLTLLTPAAAYLHVVAVVALRILEGMFEGVMLPATHALLSRWTPPAQTTSAVTFTFAGQECGLVVGMLLGGVLSDHGFAGGWPSVFYVFGAIGCLWSAAWFLLCYSSPSTHPRISAAEREYLEKAIGNINDSSIEKPPTPWCKILTSGPLLACCVAKFAHNWGYHSILDGLPLFYFDVLGFNMTKNGLLASLPFLAACIMMMVCGRLSDCMRAPGRLSTTTVRKIFLTCGLVLPSIFFILSGFFGCSRGPVVLTMIMAMGCAAFAWACVTVNSLDLSPRHAATLLGITNSTATAGSIAAPHVIGAMTFSRSTRAQWRKVFYITAAIEWFGTVVYLLFGSGEQQDWNEEEKSV